MAISCDTFLGTKPNSCNVGYATLQTVKGCIASAELFALGCILYRWKYAQLGGCKGYKKPEQQSCRKQHCLCVDTSYFGTHVILNVGKINPEANHWQ